MERFEPIPDYIKAALARRAIWPVSVKLAASADLTRDGSYCESWIIVTSDKVLVLWGHRVYKRLQGKKEVSQWVEDGIDEYVLKDIEKVSCEIFTSSGALMVRISGEDRILCSFSNGRNRIFGNMARLMDKLRDGKELTDEDFSDNDAPSYCPKCGLMYPDQTRKICPRCLDKRSVFMRVLSFVPRYKLQITLIMTCMLLSSLLRILSPYLSGSILFDQVLSKGGKYHGDLLQIVLLIALTQLFALLISIAYGRLNAEMTAQVIYDLKSDIFSAMQRLSMSFYNNRQTGGLMTRVNNDSMQLQYFFHDGLPYFIVNAINIAGIVIVMITMSWKLAILALLPMPFVIYFMKRVFPKIWEMYSRNYRKNSSMNALINDSLTGVRVVKAFGKEEEEVNRFTGANKEVYGVNKDLGNFTSTVFPLMQFTVGIGGLIVWGYGGWLVASGEITFGTLITFTGYIGMLYGPMDFMTHIVDWWSSCMNAAQRIFEIIDAVPEVADKPDPVRIPYIKGDVVLKNVTFSYVPNKPVLREINLDVRAGEMIGIVGHSGAGKSTIANLITRLYDVAQGEILIDGINVKELSSRDIRSQVAMVLQDTYLFRGTVAENIAYARPNASLEDIIRAAKAAYAHDFIMKLPDGYDTIIGAGGHNLSGGERQRISIARAVLMDPRILILDEATSAIDTETEKQIQEALDKLAKGRTTFAIAHRLSTLRNADRIVVLENGRIVEVGTHEELMKRRGVYYEMVKKQREALKIRGVGE